MEENCIFCKIANGIIPSSKVYEDEKYLALLDVMPATRGHVLIIPKEHYSTFLDVPKADLEGLIFLTQKVADGVVKAVNAEGYKIEMFNGAISGQSINHFHIHIIPRYQNDGIEIIANSNWWVKKKNFYGEGQANELAEKIKSFL
jgi:histidine triad (HIT) family protein